MVNFDKKIALIIGIIILVVIIAGGYLIFANQNANKDVASGSQCNECGVTNNSGFAYNNISSDNQSKNTTSNESNNSSSKSCCK